MSPDFLRDPLLEAVDHGFGTRAAAEPGRLVRPRQVHGVLCVEITAASSDPGEADAAWTRKAGLAVGVVTADCVPILLATPDGEAVAAVHAGWRGLAAGVVGAAVQALPAAEVRAALGPHIGACCYEVDAPVLAPLAQRFGDALDSARTPTRPGHARIDLGLLAARALVAAGVSPVHVGTAAVACTRCDAERFHSYRRDGPRAGRLLHYARAGLDTPGGPA